MDTVVLKSTVYGTEIKVPRDIIRTRYSNSLLGTTLEQDPDVEVIEITNPEITPAALFALQTYLTTNQLPDIGSQYVKVANYLGINELGLLSFPGVVTKYDVDSLMDPNKEIDLYEKLIELGREFNNSYLIWYAMTTTNPDHTKYIDLGLLKDAISEKDDEMINLLLRRSPMVDTDILVKVLAMKNYPLLERIIVNPNFDPRDIMKTVIFNGDLTALNLLLAHPKITKEMVNDVLRSAMERNKLDLIQRILQDPRSDPNISLIGVTPDPRYKPYLPGMKPLPQII